MTTEQRRKHDMFVRVRNFGTNNSDIFPAESAAGKKFGRLATEVQILEDQLVRQGRARADARKIKLETRRTAMSFVRTIAAAGRRVSIDDTTPHPFHLPQRRAATVVLTTARLFKEEAERRSSQFAELGLPPTFLADFAKAVDDLEVAVTLQQDSRAARHKARGTIEAALARGTGIVADLDVAVPATLRLDHGRLAAWFGARRVEQPGEGRSDASPPATETTIATPHAAA